MPELGGGNQTSVTESGGVVQVGVNEGPGSGLNADLLDGRELTSIETDISSAQNTATTASNTADLARSEIAAVRGGSTVLDAVLKEWTESGAYEVTSVSRDTDGVIVSASLKWPDGSAGSLVRQQKNSTWLAIDAYWVSHPDSGKTVHQGAVTRDANGEITAKPALSVAG